MIKGSNPEILVVVRKGLTPERYTKLQVQWQGSRLVNGPATSLTASMLYAKLWFAPQMSGMILSFHPIRSHASPSNLNPSVGPDI